MDKTLEEEIISLTLIDNREEKDLAIQSILSTLNSRGLDKFEELYLKGYLWYINPFDSKARDIGIVDNLKKSIKENPEYLYANAYLAYYYYDEKNYEGVINNLEELNFEFFEKRNQLWQSLKLQELLCSSKIYSSDVITGNLIEDTTGILALYYQLKDEDVAVPKELVHCIINNANKIGASILITNIKMLVNSKKHRDYFSDEEKNTISNL